VFPATYAHATELPKQFDWHNPYLIKVDFNASEIAPYLFATEKHGKTLQYSVH